MFIEKLPNLGCILAQHSNVAIEFTVIIVIIFSTIKKTQNYPRYTLEIVLRWEILTTVH
jgi:hypothetical protein